MYAAPGVGISPGGPFGKYDLCSSTPAEVDGEREKLATTLLWWMKSVACGHALDSAQCRHLLSRCLD